MTYPLKFCQHVLTVKEQEGLTYKKTAERFRVGVDSLVRWNRKIEPCLNRNKPAVELDMQALAKDVEKHPDAYRKVRAQRLGVSPSGIGHALKRLRVSRKKRLINTPEQTRAPRSTSSSKSRNGRLKGAR